ncbi:hypothetical protein U9M48_002290 [Paspalum notatum var. saurae]|uniref:Uncharacterized protein n=1 Tax=Paspalum notatum var. saurae TaxID=547442 RepID=A0AAQ3SDE8_PASNO
MQNPESRLRGEDCLAFDKQSVPWNEKEEEHIFLQSYPSRRPNSMDLLAGTFSVEMEIWHSFDTSMKGKVERGFQRS